jgi:hypothetical protein
MGGETVSVLLTTIVLGVLLVVWNLLYLLAKRFLKQSPVPRRKPVDRWIGAGCMLLVLLVIGLLAIRLDSNPKPPSQPLDCPTGSIYAPLQGLCGQL